MEYNEVLRKKLLLVPGAEGVKGFEELVGEVKQVAIAKVEVDRDLDDAVSHSVDVVLYQNTKKNSKSKKNQSFYSVQSQVNYILFCRGKNSKGIVSKVNRRN